MIALTNHTLFAGFLGGVVFNGVTALAVKLLFKAFSPGRHA